MVELHRAVRTHHHGGFAEQRQRGIGVLIHHRLPEFRFQIHKSPADASTPYVAWVFMFQRNAL
ncbi:MAG: hypothetical protein ABI887_08060 [Burkholderiales bacterium]